PSHRPIAFGLPSKQEITASETGLNEQCALRKFAAAHVSDGSRSTKLKVSRTSPLCTPIADIGAGIVFRRLGPNSDLSRCLRHVRFTLGKRTCRARLVMSQKG